MKTCKEITKPAENKENIHTDKLRMPLRRAEPLQAMLNEITDLKAFIQTLYQTNCTMNP